jgi:hypothetical protein
MLIHPRFSSGQPIAFIVGPNDALRRFDIHQLLLGTGSRIFNVSEGKPRIITREIRLPNVDPQVFDVMCRWLYSNSQELILKPAKEEDLVNLMELWTVYAELGIDMKMNAIMRCGMALMQPKHFVCPVSTVEWVYAHTSPTSKLRGYIVAIFCQRGPTPTKEMLLNTDPAIFADANEFFKVLQKVRKGNPQLVSKIHLYVICTSSSKC